MKTSFAFSSVACLLVLAACASPNGDAPDALDDEALDPAAIIVGPNGWTAEALTPVNTPVDDDPRYLAGQARFVGSGTQKAGVCLLRVSTTTACTIPTTGTAAEKQAAIDAQCAAALVKPTGGNYYCPDLGGIRRCAVRPGTQAAWCAGSPALGGALVGAGTYTTTNNRVVAQTPYISYACFSGCAVSDPSVSSQTLTTTIMAGKACPPSCQ